MYNETRRAAHCGAQQARDESRAADSEDLNVTKRKIGILGAGTWGMALARMLCVSGNDVLDVENLAKSYHFELERKTHYGILLRYELASFKKYLVEEYLNQNVFIQTAVNDVIEEFNDIEQKLIRQLNKEGLKINYNELLNVIEYLKIVIYIAHRQDEQKEEFIFDKNNEIHRIVEFLVGILEKKYAIGLSKKSIEEILKVLQKNIKRD